jgi:hypothetical protein
MLHLDVLAGRLSVEEARVERFRRLVEEAAPGEGIARSHELARAYRQSYECCWHLVDGATELLTLIKAEGLPVVVVHEQQCWSRSRSCGVSGSRGWSTRSSRPKKSAAQSRPLGFFKPR